MTRPYKTLSETDSELVRAAMRDADGPAIPEESTRGLMTPSRFSGISSTVQLTEAPRRSAGQGSDDAGKSFLESFLRRIAGSSDDRTAVEQALLNQSMSSREDLEGYLDSWSNMPPAPGRDQTRAALGTSPEFEETASRLTRDLMRDFDLTETQAAALVGNLAVESSNFQVLQEMNPVVEGSRGGYGFAQWTGDRRVAFENWAEENGLDPSSYEANYGYLRKELSETDDVIGNIGRNTIARLRQTDNLQDATTLVMEYYLRPGIPHEARRQASAQQILGLMSRQE